MIFFNHCGNCTGCTLTTRSPKYVYWHLHPSAVNHLVRGVLCPWPFLPLDVVSQPSSSILSFTVWKNCCCLSFSAPGKHPPKHILSVSKKGYCQPNPCGAAAPN